MKHFLVLALLISAPALARESPEWTYCDFGIDPKAGLIAVKNWAGNGEARGIAQQLHGGGRFGGSVSAPPMDPAAACAAALASPDLRPEDWARRTSLLMASAAHRIAAGDAGALADLDAATAAILPGLDAAERARSLDAAIAMLRALAIARAGDAPKAVGLVTAAAAARPWSGQFQALALRVLTSLPGGAAASAAIADRQLLLGEQAREQRAKARQAAGDFAGAASDWALAKPAVIEPTTVTVPMRGVFVNNTAGWPITMIDPARVGAAALAAAFAGDAQTARRWLGVARAAAATAPVMAAPIMPNGITGPAFPTVDKAQQDAEFARQAALVEAAVQHQAGQSALARAAVAALPALRADAASVQAVARILGQAQPSVPETAAVDPRLLFAMLPRYEGADAVALAASESVPFTVGFGGRSMARQRRNTFSGSAGFFKSAGFKAKPMKSGAGTTVTFTGDASSAFAVEEMTLLRAAELAAAAGKPQFIVLGRRDYQRTSQFMMNGKPYGNAVPAGFQSELDVAFVDGTDDRAIVAADVIAVLGPLYRRRDS